MNILSNIAPKIRLATRQDPSTEGDIRELQAFSPIPVPDDYLQLVSEGTELEFVCNECCFRIWGAKGCIEMNEAYEIQQNIPNSLAIGDNEGGSAIVYLPQVENPGLYRISFGCLDVEEAQFIAGSLSDLLMNGRNTQVLA